MITAFITFFIFLLGISLGSFLSVLVFRLQKKEKGMLFGRSHCPHCKKNLQAKDLIPLLSFLLLRGKCRYCHQKLSPYYFILEITCGLILLLFFLKFPFLAETPGTALSVDWQNLLQFLFYSGYGILFMGIFVYDLQTMEIPDIFLFPLVLLTLLGSLAIDRHSTVDLLIALLIALIFFGGQIMISKGTWLGEGDLYMGIAMAFLFGWQLLIAAIIITYLAGAIISLILLTTKNAHGKSKIPFAPFMVLGSFVTILFGSDLTNFYLSLLSF